MLCQIINTSGVWLWLLPRISSKIVSTATVCQDCHCFIAVLLTTTVMTKYTHLKSAFT